MLRLSLGGCPYIKKDTAGFFQAVGKLGCRIALDRARDQETPEVERMMSASSP
jgi:hypothetical protein